MTRIRMLIARLAGVLRKGKLERELEAEVQSHLEMQAEDNVRDGMDIGTARMAALRSFGGTQQMKERYRDLAGIPAIETVMQDLRHGGRLMTKAPGFTLVAVLSLALGIGGTTAVFTLMDPLVLKPLPVPEPDRLVAFQTDRLDPQLFLPDMGDLEETIQAIALHSPISYAVLDQLTTRSEVFSGTFDYTSAESNFTLRTAGEGRAGETPVVVGEASGGFFPTLGVGMSIGRPFLDSDQNDAAAGQPPVVVISDSLWRSRFGSAHDVLGSKVTLVRGARTERTETEVTIIGVAEPGFDGIEPGTAVDIWKPTARVAGNAPIPVGPRILSAVVSGGYGMGRLRPGVSFDSAQTQVNTIFEQVLSEWAAEFGSAWTTEQRNAFLRQRVNLTPASEGWTLVWGRLGQPLIVLMASASCLLLIGCANIGALLMARGEGRRQELTLRMSVGGGRIRLIRQLLTESLVLGSIGALTGLAVAYSTVRLLLVYAPEGGAIAESVALDDRALAFATGTGLVSTILFGLLPAVRTTRLDLNRGLRGTAGPANRGTAGERIGRLLVVSQLALSLILLVGAGLFIETLGNLRDTAAGFDRQVVRFEFDGPTLPSSELFDRIRGLPGVESATVSNDIGLLGGQTAMILIQVEGRVPPSGLANFAVSNVSGPGFFETMGIRLLAGRTFRLEDAQRAGEVAVVSETLARNFFGEENSIGRRFSTNAPPYLTGDALQREVEILGVVEDVIFQNLRAGPGASVYFPLSPTFVPDRFTFAVRTSLDLGETANAIRSVLASSDSGMRIAGIQTMDAIVEDTVSRERFLAQLATTFGVLAMALTAIGLYGMLSFAVGRRIREIGIRMALGARIRDVLEQLMRETAWTVGLGLLLGVIGALMATPAISSLLFDVAPAEPLILAGAALVLIAASAIAAYLPARRAAGVDPLVSLRHE